VLGDAVVRVRIRTRQRGLRESRLICSPGRTIAGQLEAAVNHVGVGPRGDGEPEKSKAGNACRRPAQGAEGVAGASLLGQCWWVPIEGAGSHRPPGDHLDSRFDLPQFEAGGSCWGPSHMASLFEPAPARLP
jgi:hypothetical protein